MRIREVKKWIVGVGVLVLVVGGAVAGVGMRSEEEGPMRLVAVCVGEGTKVVSCQWIPLKEELQTKAEKELASRGDVKR